MTKEHLQPPTRKGPRTELKFLLRTADAHALLARWKEMLAPDPHVANQSEPVYRVHSIYFDTPERHALQRKDFPKHRLRRYDDSDKRYLEEKFSRGQAVWKRRVPFSDDDLTHVDINSKEALPRDPQLAWFTHRFRTLMLSPLVEISYDRFALVGEHGLRITCDFAPRAMSSHSPGGTYLPLLEGEAILEIKSDGAPGSNGIVTRPFLSDLAREATSFSKYAQGIRRLEVGSPTPHG